MMMRSIKERFSPFCFFDFCNTRSRYSTFAQMAQVHNGIGQPHGGRGVAVADKYYLT